MAQQQAAYGHLAPGGAPAPAPSGAAPMQVG